MMHAGERTEDKRQVRRTQLACSPRGLDLLGQADTRTLVPGGLAPEGLVWLAHGTPHGEFRVQRSRFKVQSKESRVVSQIPDSRP